MCLKRQELLICAVQVGTSFRHSIFPLLHLLLWQQLEEYDLIERIEGGWTEFDIGLATPQVMPKIGKLGRILGRKGLMPNPRSGTMVQPQDLPRAILEAKGGRTEYRTDRTAIIHSSLGKVSFDADMLVDNLAALASAIIRDRPDGIKGAFFRSAYVTSTMGPSVPLDVPALQALESPE